MADLGPLQLTRVTRGFEHTLFRVESKVGRRFLWEATVDMVTDSRYDFAGNAARVQELVKSWAVLIDVQVLRPAEDVGQLAG